MRVAPTANAQVDRDEPAVLPTAEHSAGVARARDVQRAEAHVDDVRRRACRVRHLAQRGVHEQRRVHPDHRLAQALERICLQLRAPRLQPAGKLAAAPLGDPLATVAVAVEDAQ